MDQPVTTHRQHTGPAHTPLQWTNQSHTRFRRTDQAHTPLQWANQPRTRFQHADQAHTPFNGPIVAVATVATVVAVATGVTGPITHVQRADQAHTPSMAQLWANRSHTRFRRTGQAHSLSMDKPATHSLSTCSKHTLPSMGRMQQLQEL